MDSNELLLSVITKIYNKTEDEVKPLIFNDKGELTEDAFDTIVGLDVAKVTRLKKENNKFDDGYGKGVKETAEKIEKHFKESLGVSVDGNYEAIAEAVKEQMTNTKAKGKDITEDDIKKHPYFLQMEKNYVPKVEHEKVVNEYGQYKSTIDRTLKVDRVKEKAYNNLNNKWKVAFPQDSKRKETLVNAYIRDVTSFDDVEIQEDGQIIVIKNGKRVEDAHGNVLPFDKYTEEIATGYFEFLKQDAKGGAGNKNEGGGGATKTYSFTSKQELAEAYDKLTTDDERKQFIKDTAHIKFTS